MIFRERVGWVELLRDPSPGSLKMMGFAALYPSYKVRSNSDLLASGGEVEEARASRHGGSPQ